MTEYLTPEECACIPLGAIFGKNTGPLSGLMNGDLLLRREYALSRLRQALRWAERDAAEAEVNAAAQTNPGAKASQMKRAQQLRAHADRIATAINETAKSATICRNCEEPATVETPGGPLCAACYAEFERRDLETAAAYLADNPRPPKSYRATFTPPPSCPDCGEILEMNYHDADGNCIHQPL